MWSDEFDVDGLPLSSKWTYDVGDGCPNVCGWGNNELQSYTKGEKKNVRIEKGKLIIEAHREIKGNQSFTSARLKSNTFGDWRYGKIEVSAKLPRGRGVWPAIWMLPSKWEHGPWPSSGEIDIMEHVGYLPDSLFGAVHTKSFNHVQGTQVAKSIYCNTLSTQFHTYGMEWTKNKIDLYFDGQIFLTYTNMNKGFEAWPFDKEFYLLLNIAAGGNWGGKMGVDMAIWPQQFVIDYVRIYQLKINT